MKSTTTQHEEGAPVAVETAATLRIENPTLIPGQDCCARCHKPTCHLFGGFCIECDKADPMSDSEDEAAQDATPVRCCHYCGTVEESSAPFVDRLGNHIFCDDNCKADFFEASRMIGPDATTEKEPFKIDSLSKYEWWTGKLADVAERRKRIAANYKKQCAQLDADERRAMGLQSMAAEFVKSELQRTKATRQSITTLHGTGGFTKYGASVVLLPDATTSAAAMEAARAAGCVRIVPEVPAEPEREEVDTAAYLKLAKDALKAKSDLPPGCDTTPPREVFTFKLAKDEEEKK